MESAQVIGHQILVSHALHGQVMRQRRVRLFAMQLMPTCGCGIAVFGGYPSNLGLNGSSFDIRRGYGFQPHRIHRRVIARRLIGESRHRFGSQVVGISKFWHYLTGCGGRITLLSCLIGAEASLSGLRLFSASADVVEAVPVGCRRPCCPMSPVPSPGRAAQE